MYYFLMIVKKTNNVTTLRSLPWLLNRFTDNIKVQYNFRDKSANLTPGIYFFFLFSCWQSGHRTFWSFQTMHFHVKKYFIEPPKGEGCDLYFICPLSKTWCNSELCHCCTAKKLCFQLYVRLRVWIEVKSLLWTLKTLKEVMHIWTIVISCIWYNE